MRCGERWREKNNTSGVTVGQEGFGMGRSCRALRRVLSSLSLCTHHIPAGAAEAAAPVFSSCLQRFVWRKCSGDWISLQNTEAIRLSLFISQAFCSMKAGIQTTSDQQMNISSFLSHGCFSFPPDKQTLVISSLGSPRANISWQVSRDLHPLKQLNVLEL